MKLDTTSPLEHLAAFSIAFALGFAAHAMVALADRRARREAESLLRRHTRHAPPAATGT